MPDSFLPAFELYVVLAIARLGDNAYGVTIRQEIESRTGRSVSVGALFTTLARLEKKGFAESAAGSSESGKRGRPRKYCTLTPAGLQAMRHSLEMLDRMADGLPAAETGGA